MRNAIQQQIPGFSVKLQKSFGGSLLKSHPKVQRAIPLDRALHLVVRSTQSKGSKSFLRKDFAEQIFAIVLKQSQRFNVKLYRYANAGNHLHMVVKSNSRQGYKGFIRAICGLIARLVLGTERGQARTLSNGIIKKLKFWDARPFTRILSWGRDFKAVSNYLMQNTLEAHGFVAYTPRKAKPLRPPAQQTVKLRSD